ncbi:hypothetical protein OSK38_27270, partial [Escherichia coli]|nr:hypothetical protein [Escherichia coli]
FIDLMSKKFLDSEAWDAKAHFHAILSNCRKEIKGIYLIENGHMRKLSEKAAHAMLAIKEDAARKHLA